MKNLSNVNRNNCAVLSIVALLAVAAIALICVSSSFAAEGEHDQDAAGTAELVEATVQGTLPEISGNEVSDKEATGEKEALEETTKETPQSVLDGVDLQNTEADDNSVNGTELTTPAQNASSEITDVVELGKTSGEKLSNVTDDVDAQTVTFNGATLTIPSTFTGNIVFKVPAGYTIKFVGENKITNNAASKPSNIFSDYDATGADAISVTGDGSFTLICGASSTYFNSVINLYQFNTCSVNFNGVTVSAKGNFVNTSGQVQCTLVAAKSTTATVKATNSSFSLNGAVYGSKASVATLFTGDAEIISSNSNYDLDVNGRFTSAAILQGSKVTINGGTCKATLKTTSLYSLYVYGLLAKTDSVSLNNVDEFKFEVSGNVAYASAIAAGGATSIKGGKYTVNASTTFSYTQYAQYPALYGINSYDAALIENAEYNCTIGGNAKHNFGICSIVSITTTNSKVTVKSETTNTSYPVYAVYAQNYGPITSTGTEFEFACSKTPGIFYGIYSSSVTSTTPGTGEVKITGGKITSTVLSEKTDGTKAYIVLSDKAIEMDGVTYTSTASANISEIKDINATTGLTVKDSTLSITHTPALSTAVAYAACGSDVVFTNNTFKYECTGAQATCCAISGTASVGITGGSCTINATTTNSAEDVRSSGISSTGTTTLTNAEYNCTIGGTVVYAYGIESSENATISGGKLNFEISPNSTYGANVIMVNSTKDITINGVEYTSSSDGNIDNIRETNATETLTVNNSSLDITQKSTSTDEVSCYGVKGKNIAFTNNYFDYKNSISSVKGCAVNSAESAAITGGITTISSLHNTTTELYGIFCEKGNVALDGCTTNMNLEGTGQNVVGISAEFEDKVGVLSIKNGEYRFTSSGLCLLASVLDIDVSDNTFVTCTTKNTAMLGGIICAPAVATTSTNLPIIEEGCSWDKATYGAMDFWFTVTTCDGFNWDIPEANATYHIPYTVTFGYNPQPDDPTQGENVDATTSGSTGDSTPFALLSIVAAVAAGAGVYARKRTN